MKKSNNLYDKKSLRRCQVKIKPAALNINYKPGDSEKTAVSA